MGTPKEMKFKSIIFAAVMTCVAAVTARETAVGPIPSPLYDDTEVSTNIAFDVGSELGREFQVRLDLNALSNNNVTVSFGNDTDGDGVLSASEADLEVGWDCGAWFYRDRLSGVSDFVERDDARRTLNWKTALGVAKRPKYVLAKEARETVFAFRATDGMFRNEWNLVRVVVRGLGEQSSVVVTSVRAIGLVLTIR